MRLSSTITLFILAILLGGLAIVHTGETYRNKLFGAPAVQPGDRLFDIRRLNDTKSIRLEKVDNTTLSIEANGHIWEAKEPWEDRVDQTFVKSLFSFTSNLVVREVIDRDDLDLEDFGLKKNNIRVTMYDEDGEETCDYRIGRTTAWKIPSEDGKSTQPTIFIRLSDKHKKDKIYICTTTSADTIHTIFKDDFARFRDHHPFHFSPRYLDQVRIQNEEVELTLSQQSASSGWIMTKPNELRIDPEALKQLFLDLKRINALKVEDRSSVTLPTAADGVTQAREISIHFANQPDDITLRIYPGNEQGIALATVSDRPDTVFHLPLTKAAAPPDTTALNLIQAGVNDLRSKNMVHMNGKELGTIIIRPGGLQDILIKRDRNDHWRIRRPDGWQLVNIQSLSRLITAVTQDKVIKFVTDAASDLNPYGLSQPMVLLGFNSFEGEAIRLAIGRGPEDQKIYARNLKHPQVWEISPETFGKIALYPWQWRLPHVWYIAKSDVQSITIQRNNQPEIQLTYNHFAEKWTSFTQGRDTTAQLNPNRANFFLDSLTALKASKWIGPMHPNAMEYLKKPDTVIRISMTETNDAGEEIPVTKTLKIARTQRGLIFFSKVDTTPVGNNREHESSYFYLAPDVISKLHVDLFE